MDLAGSERSSRAETEGKEVREAGKINKSIMTLGQCLEALKFNSNLIVGQTNKKPVPFRDSKLTMIFQEYFLGTIINFNCNLYYRQSKYNYNS